MRSDNALYLLAKRPFQNGQVNVAVLAHLVDAYVSHPPLDPFPDKETFLEALPEKRDWSQRPSLQFQSYLTFLTFLIGVLWTRNHMVGVAAARNLWEMSQQDPACAVVTDALLPALEKHPAYTQDPETHALVAGLRGLFAMVAPPKSVSAEILDQLDQGIAFPHSGFNRHELQFLLWNHRDRSDLPTWQGLQEHAQREPERVRTVFLAIYPRAFFALRYGRMAKDHLESRRLKSLETIDEGAREILATPGLAYLSGAEQEELHAHSARTHEVLLGILQSCLYLLDQANSLLVPADSWPLTYAIHIASAEARLRGFQSTGEVGLLSAARGFALQGAWATRRHSPLFYGHALHLLAQTYLAWRKPERAEHLWIWIRHHLERYRDKGFFAEMAATTNAQLAQLALEQDNFKVARDYALEAVDQASHFFSDRYPADGRPEEQLNLDGWSASLFDTAIAACVASGDGAQALEIFEQWYAASSLTRHLGLSPVDEASLLNNLPRRTALVYLCLDQLGTSILLVAKGETTACWRTKFTWSDLQTAIGPWLKAIWQLRAAPPTDEFQRFKNFSEAMGHTLSGLTPLVQSLAEELQKRSLYRVVLIPGRGLGGLPLHAVPLNGVGEDLRYFGDGLDLLYAPNATVWLAATRNQIARRHEKVFEGFGTDDAGFSVELDQAALLWGSDGRPRLNATPSKFLQVASETAVLHVSCHGWFQIVEMEADQLEVDAGLHLGGGRLDWRDLLQHLRLPKARLVVLSACESAVLSHRDLLNQQFGLPYAFLAAGAPLLLGSSWRVESNATSLLMTRFHENIRHKHLPSSHALAEAQRWLRSMDRAQVGDALARYFVSQAKNVWIPEGVRPYERPYWWAGFRLVGADLAREDRNELG